MRRASAAVAMAAILLSLFPGVAIGDRLVRYSEHRVSAYCEGEVEGGFVSAILDSSETFGDYAFVDIWLDPAVPFEGPATLSGNSAVIAVDEGDPVVLAATLGFFDADGVPIGEGAATATMERVGEPEVIPGEPFGNVQSRSTRTVQTLEGQVVVTLPDASQVEVGCFGEISDESIFETNPHAFTSGSEGVRLDCFWETPDAVAFLFLFEDQEGFFGSSDLRTQTLTLVADGAGSGGIDASGFEFAVALRDEVTGDPYAAQASGELTPIGDPVTSMLVSETGRSKVVEQALAPDGTIEFSTGDVFPIDDEHCNANTFIRHSVSTAPAGPKPGKPPVNDTIDGAIELGIPSVVNVQTTGTASDAEIQVQTCPEGPFDEFGHTVWYTVQGTGSPITVDTAGSNIDTVVGVFVEDGDGLVEIACNDDVLLDPVGASFQGALTFDSEAGVTYFIEVGGYLFPFDPQPQSGRVRLRIS